MDSANEPRLPLLRVARHRIGIDGAGVTTLVAGAGCPLSCRWCLNRDVLARGRPEPVTPRALYERVRVDDLYFRATGGGVVFGGGEPLLHADFLAAFRTVCGRDWRLTVETSLAVPWEKVALAAEAADEFIFDCKDMDEARYRAYTGSSGALMRENLARLLPLIGPERLHVRVPLIPGFNTPEDQEDSVRRLLALGATRIERFAYVVR